MSVNSVNPNNLKAYYPQYLENKKKRALGVAITGGLATAAGTACYYTKAIKNSKLLFAITLLTSIASAIGLTSAAGAQKKLDEFNKQIEPFTAKV